MDYSTFSKPKMWANVVGGIVCYVMFAYELYVRLEQNSNAVSSILFLFLALNCTFRVFSYFKLNRMKKRMDDESQIIRAERRQGIIITIVSDATGMLCLLVYLIHSVLIKGPKALDIFCAFCAICFGVILVQCIQNLKRFDRL